MADGYVDLTPVIRAVERSEARMTAGIATSRPQQQQPFDFFMGLGGV